MARLSKEQWERKMIFYDLETLIKKLVNEAEVGCCFTNSFIAENFIRTFGVEKYCDIFKRYISLGREMNNGFVYVIKGQYKGKELYKIGKANSLKARLRKFEVIIPFDIELITAFYIRNPLELESSLHKKFKHKRIAGEWFDLDLRDIVEIEKIGLKKEAEDFMVNIELCSKKNINKDDYIEYLESLLALNGIKIEYNEVVEYGKKKS